MDKKARVNRDETTTKAVTAPSGKKNTQVPWRETGALHVHPSETNEMCHVTDTEQ